MGREAGSRRPELEREVHRTPTPVNYDTGSTRNLCSAQLSYDSGSTATLIDAGGGNLVEQRTLFLEGTMDGAIELPHIPRTGIQLYEFCTYSGWARNAFPGLPELLDSLHVFLRNLRDSEENWANTVLDGRVGWGTTQVTTVLQIRRELRVLEAHDI
eukprot:GHVU01116977.1.p1 GENE.GHVU01116977.1~~GHVU01116977.1.p1  ORF type:complete len:157 (+),score=17.47 GHVU01116977.1:760-1230(+)